MYLLIWKAKRSLSSLTMQKLQEAIKGCWTRAMAGFAPNPVVQESLPDVGERAKRLDALPQRAKNKVEITIAQQHPKDNEARFALNAPQAYSLYTTFYIQSLTLRTGVRHRNTPYFPRSSIFLVATPGL